MRRIEIRARRQSVSQFDQLVVILFAK